MPYTLSERQERSYTDLCDIWRPNTTIPAGEYPANTAYELSEEDVPCRFVTASSVDQVQGPLGLVEGEDLLTVDTLRLPENALIDSSWIAVNRAQLDGGGNGPYFNKAWILRGEPKRRVSRAGRPAGRVVAYASRMPDNAIPAEILDHYA